MLSLFEKNQIYFNWEGWDILQQKLNQNNYSKIFILTDSNTNECCLPTFLSAWQTETAIEILEIPAGESFKNIETVVGLWEVLLDYEADRKSLFVNLGGGVVTDLGAFVAATFKRGIDFLHVPTTLLAMVDASLGGKNGIDFNGVKNQIGTIQNPIAIFILPEFLETLTTEQWKCGLAEMFKHGLIQHPEHWKKLQKLSNFTIDDLLELIQESMLIKLQITEIDPLEKNERKALNFGHTIGHAMESYSLQNDVLVDLLHGEAVAIGILLESHLSFQKKYLSEVQFNEIKKTILKYFDFPDWSSEQFASCLHYLQYDKKNEHGKIKFVLLKNIGKFIVNEEVTEEQIWHAWNYFQN